MIKKVVAIILFILVVCTVAGCTTPGTSPSPSPSATHDPLLEQYFDAYNQTARERHPNNLTAWRVTWNNSTAVQIQDSYTYHPSYSNTTTIQYFETNTIIKFGSVDEATKYVDSHSQGYKLSDTSPSPDGAYQRLTGHAPTVYLVYFVGGKVIEQVDQFVKVGVYERTTLD